MYSAQDGKPRIIVCILPRSGSPRFLISYSIILDLRCFSIQTTTEMDEKLSADEKSQPFAFLDGRKGSVIEGRQIITVTSLQDADEALAFLENHPRASEIAEEGNAILEDHARRRKLIRKIDFTIAPLLASVYFLQFLDKTTISYTAIMGLRTDTHLHGQEYSYLGMLFYIGELYCASQHVARTRTYKPPTCRILGNGIPNSIHCTAPLSSLAVSGYQHHHLGCRSRLSRRLQRLCRPRCVPYPSRGLRIASGPYPSPNYCDVVQERRTRTASVMVLRHELLHSDRRRCRRLRGFLGHGRIR